MFPIVVTKITFVSYARASVVRIARCSKASSKPYQKLSATRKKIVSQQRKDTTAKPAFHSVLQGVDSDQEKKMHRKSKGNFAPESEDDQRVLERPDEMKFSGIRSVLAIREARPSDLIKVYVREDISKQTQVGQLLSWMSTQKKAYRVVPNEELDRLAQTVHHEGIVALARRKNTLSIADAMAAELSGIRQQLRVPSTLSEKATAKGKPKTVTPQSNTYRKRVTVLLEGVKNPHNLGAIIRTCAFFGVPRVFASYDPLASADFPRACSSAAVHRTSEGGAEYVDVVPCLAAELHAAIAELHAAQYAIVATSSVAISRESLFDVRVSTWLQSRNVALLFGNETTGLTRKAISAADKTVEIPGAGRMTSLNVAQSAVAVLTELMRVHERFRK